MTIERTDRYISETTEDLLVWKAIRWIYDDRYERHVPASLFPPTRRCLMDTWTWIPKKWFSWVDWKGRDVTYPPGARRASIWPGLFCFSEKWAAQDYAYTYQCNVAHVIQVRIPKGTDVVWGKAHIERRITGPYHFKTTLADTVCTRKLVVVS
jgi:hypothetical protein